MSFDWTIPKKPDSVYGYLSSLYLMYCIHVGTYVFEPWERVLCNIVFLVLSLILIYATYTFLPQSILAMLKYFAILI
ncbi:unnamed protein product [Clavelina lepadiformis]|uniref:Serine palmitoyltransferase small subunit B n=1 Tax=Clavelina lepadiformis TaxID=159417 RepID=A0ABP0FGX8_CLALP